MTLDSNHLYFMAHSTRNVHGTVRVMLDGKAIAQRPLVAIDAVAEGGFFKRLWHELLMWWQAD